MYSIKIVYSTIFKVIKQKYLAMIARVGQNGIRVPLCPMGKSVLLVIIFVANYFHLCGGYFINLIIVLKLMYICSQIKFLNNIRYIKTMPE